MKSWYMFGNAVPSLGTSDRINTLLVVRSLPKTIFVVEGLVHPWPRVWCRRKKTIIVKDPTITLIFLSLLLREWSYGSVYPIVNQNARKSKKCARLVPHQLTEELKQHRVTIWRSWLEECKPNSPKIFSDGTGNAYCVSLFIVEDKQSSMVCMAEDEPHSDVLKTGFRARKRMSSIFFSTQRAVALDLKLHKATITDTYYTTTVLTEVFQHVQKPHAPDVALDFFCIMIVQYPTKLVWQRATWMRKTYTWWNVYPTHLTLVPCDFWLFHKI